MTLGNITLYEMRNIGEYQKYSGNIILNNLHGPELLKKKEREREELIFCLICLPDCFNSIPNLFLLSTKTFAFFFLSLIYSLCTFTFQVIHTKNMY